MTIDELAETCAAQEAAIEDVYAEYEWDRKPPYTTQDITGKTVAIPTGPQVTTWATARPFEDRFLRVDSTEQMDAQGRRYHATDARSYNGKVATWLQVMGDPAGGRPSRHGTITRSRRFLLPGSRTTTPQRFTLLRFREQRPDYPLSQALRKTECVDLISDIQPVGHFRAIRCDFYAEGLRDKQGNRILLSHIYFAVDHACAPVQFELFNGPEMIQRDVVSELVEAAPGIWYPKDASTTERDKDGNEYTYTCRVSKLLVNQGLPQEFFDIDFPPGTRIQDEVSRLPVLTPLILGLRRWFHHKKV